MPGVEMTSTTMPPWLEAKLIRDGTMTADHVTVHAKPRRCHDCGLFILVGLDDLRWRVEVDIRPTTSAGECFALLTGRASYALDGDELYERTASRLTYRRADDHPVYVSHECNSPPIPANEKFLPKEDQPTDGPPPF